MFVATMPMMDWLRDQRRIAQLQNDWMALMFDLEGALDADQSGLIWHTRQSLLITGLELYLRQAGQPVASYQDAGGHACAVMEQLTVCAPALAQKFWTQFNVPAPVDDDQIRAAVASTLALLAEHVGVADSRLGSIQSWADQVLLLREVAKSIGIAQSDQWYLSRSTGMTAPSMDWYDEVMIVVGGPAASSRTGPAS